MAATADYKSLSEAETAAVRRALNILSRNLGREPLVLGSSHAVRDYLRLKYGTAEVEVFNVILLDGQNRVIAHEEISRGAVDQVVVYPREVARAVLRHNAVGVLLVHNHPSGAAEPSGADQMLTVGLMKAMELIGARVLDHFVVAGTKIISLAERDLMKLPDYLKPPPPRKRRKRGAKS